MKVLCLDLHLFKITDINLFEHIELPHLEKNEILLTVGLAVEAIILPEFVNLDMLMMSKFSASEVTNQFKILPRFYYRNFYC